MDNPQSIVTRRDDTIDVVRGIAIVMMIYANTAGYILTEPHGLGIRLLGSFAAPLFILVAGMMVGLSCDSKGYSFGYFLIRGLLVILASALVVDVLIWQLLPFMSMEVLYLIGISIPLTALFHRLSLTIRSVAVGLVFASAALLRWQFGYEELPTSFGFDEYEGDWQGMFSDVLVLLRTDWVEQQFIDGWFPLFPWLGFALAGSVVATWRWEKTRLSDFSKYPIPLVGCVILAAGAAIWWQYPGPLYVRNGFSEMFYPATSGYVITSFGIIILLFGLVDRKPNLAVYGPLRVLGQCSLFVYLFQWGLAEHLLLRFFPDMTATPMEHTCWYLGVVSICVAVAYGVIAIKKRWRSMPFLIKFFLGS